MGAGEAREVMKTQLCKVYISGMPEHANQTTMAVNCMIENGWLVDHIFLISSGMVMVVYGREGSEVRHVRPPAHGLPGRKV
jgi:hypothetical protein